MKALQLVADAMSQHETFADAWRACIPALRDAAGAERVELCAAGDYGAGNLVIPLRCAGAARQALVFFGAATADAATTSLLEACALVIAARAQRDDLIANGERLARLAFTDALTGISNRRAFDEALTREFSNASRTQTPLGVLILDVDYFKLFNDNYGHQRGDECLQSVAQALRRAVARAGDFVGRYGGEEFVALLPNTGLAGALDLAEQIRAQVAALEVEHCGSSLGRLSVSVGVASCVPSVSDLADELVQAADRELYRAKLNGRNRAAGADHQSVTEPAFAVQKKTKNHLPLQLVPLVGRVRELDALVDLAGRSRLMTVVGVGGSGKTRLAVEAADRLAERYADGAHFVDMAPLRDPTTIVPAIAQALEIPIPHGDDSTASLASELARREMLLVLDNCEHLSTAVAGVAQTLLQNAPRVRIIATSREPLALTGEAVYDLPLLNVPPSDAISVQEAMSYDAVRLFVDRAHAVRSEFTLDETNVRSVVGIARTLDGLALAIELTAARVGYSTIEELAQNVRQHVLPLGDGHRAEPRERTLESAIEWSYALLTGAEQSILRRLAIFVGGFSSEAASRVCSDEAHVPQEILDLLVRLARKSMLVATNDGRYHLLEPIRQFALFKLEGIGARNHFSQRHAEYYGAAARAARAVERDTSRTAWTFRVGADIDNYRAATTWALYEQNDVDVGAGIVGDIATVWEKYGIAEGQRDVERALSYSTGHPYVFLAHSWMLDYFGVLPRVQLKSASSACAIFETTNDRRGLFDGLLRRAQAFANLRRHDEASVDLDRADELLVEIGKPGYAIHVARARARLALMREDWDEAQARYSSLIGHYRAEGNDHHAAVLLRSLAEIEFARGQVEKAIACTNEPECLALDVSQRMVMDTNLTCYLVAAGQYDAARAVGRKVIGQTWERQLRVGRVLTIQHLALGIARGGDMERAARLSGYVDAAVAQLEFQREYTERFSYERLIALIQERLPVPDIERCARDGAALSDEDATREACSLPGGSSE